MANIREIQSRINSVKDTMKITNAMYMISSSKADAGKEKSWQIQSRISMHFRVRSAVFSVICRNCITVISIREKRSRQKNERSDRS